MDYEQHIKDEVSRQLAAIVGDEVRRQIAAMSTPKIEEKKQKKKKKTDDLTGQLF